MDVLANQNFRKILGQAIDFQHEIEYMTIEIPPWIRKNMLSFEDGITAT